MSNMKDDSYQLFMARIEKLRSDLANGECIVTDEDLLSTMNDEQKVDDSDDDEYSPAFIARAEKLCALTTIEDLNAVYFNNTIARDGTVRVAGFRNFRHYVDALGTIITQRLAKERRRLN